VGVEFADGFFEDTRERAAPSGVDCSYDPFLVIDKKDGDAVGGLDAEKKAGSFGERCVAFTGFL